MVFLHYEIILYFKISQDTTTDFKKTFSYFPCILFYSFMDSEDGDTSGEGICDISLGREIMLAVERNDPNRNGGGYSSNRRDSGNERNQHFDSSTADSELSVGEVLGEMDEYLDEALDEDDDYVENTPPVIFKLFNYFKEKQNNLYFLVIRKKDQFLRIVFRISEVHQNKFVQKILLNMTMKIVIIVIRNAVLRLVCSIISHH